MQTRKYVIPGVVQGYTGTQLADDLKKLANELRSEILYEGGKSEYFYDDDVTKLIVGKACAAVRDEVDTSLKKLFEKLKKLLPADAVMAEQHYKMGPLKKVSRVVEKAAHYAVCDKDNHAKPQLQRVRDILRATMVFTPAAWGEKTDQIGSKMIDTINDHFNGAVVQIKNRFIHDKYPNFAQLDGIQLPADLKKFIESTFKQTLWGRDSFYRDLQLLIRIDNDKFDNGQGMTHTILELQLASSKMYSGKTEKNAKGDSGHDMYKNVRAVSEYCEFLWWQENHKKNGSKVALPDAQRYYNVANLDFPSFTEQAETMARLYQTREVEKITTALADAIDDSKLFKSAKK